MFSQQNNSYILWNTILTGQRCVTFVYAAEYYFKYVEVTFVTFVSVVFVNDVKVCYICLCCICLTM